MMVIADVMIPSIVEHFPVMLVLLVPVALIEACVLSRRHLLRFRESTLLSLRANLRSTLVGLPLGYACALAGLIPAGLFAAILPKRFGSPLAIILLNAVGHGGTATPRDLDEVGYFVGTLLVMIPYYLVTLRVERKHLAKLRPDLDTPQLATTVRIMNAITYGLLAIPIITGAVLAIINVLSTQSVAGVD